MQRTPFYEAHLAAGAKMVEFCGWQMPINYGSQIKEHEAVRSNAGMFDVSHMAVTDISGLEARPFIRYLLSNDVAKLDKHGFGKALYSAMLNSDAGIIDDLIVYSMPFGYRLVTNAGTYAKDMEWIESQAAKFQVSLTKRRDLAILAVQGSQAIAKVAQIKPELAGPLSSLKPFMALEDNDWFYATTGYTGEDGLEIMLPNKDAITFWQELLRAGVTPCGLGARDTLRLEAGMNLYGHDMDETINPLECNMDWVIDLSDEVRDFIGKAAYLKLKASGSQFRQVGLVMQGKGILREGQSLIKDGSEVGVITSGTFSPSLKLSIAIAKLQSGVTENVTVDIRGNLEAVKVTSLPFIRNSNQAF
ncbi:MAG: glycine cleavage system aminomethyltransferase GcvT [Burkholderiales bacterium]